MRSILTRWVPFAFLGLCLGCLQSRAPTLRVTGDPYGNVDWVADLRLTAQHHDHAGTDTARILAYDAAGYDVIGLMSYSGVPSLPASWQARRWPPEAWLPSSLVERLQSIKLFIPNAEEVGFGHVTSPFLTSYIEARTASGPPDSRSELHYSSTQECIDLIVANGGMAFLAHPWSLPTSFVELRGYHGVEIYSAFAEWRRRDKQAFFVEADRNLNMLSLWDELLMRRQNVLGIAVNDHRGPDYIGHDLDPDIRDSGKIVVLTREASFDSYRRALESGSFFAIKDLGVQKNRYPTIRSIAVTETTITINTDASVRWIGNGRVVSLDASLNLALLPLDTRYVRGEIVNAEGSTVFTQAFSVAPVGGQGILDVLATGSN